MASFRILAAKERLLTARPSPKERVAKKFLYWDSILA
jgi:hypothetical protein